VSVKISNFPHALSSGDLLTFLAKVIHFYSYFCVVCTLAYFIQLLFQVSIGVVQSKSHCLAHIGLGSFLSRVGIFFLVGTEQNLSA
jgi:hypothetical protein